MKPSPIAPVLFSLDTLWTNGIQFTDKDEWREVREQLKQLSENITVHAAGLEMINAGNSYVARITVKTDDTRAGSVSFELSLYHTE